MSVSFAVYMKSQNAVQARNIGIVSTDTIDAASRLHAAFCGITAHTLRKLIAASLAYPLIEHKREGVTVWAVPVIPAL